MALGDGGESVLLPGVLRESGGERLVKRMLMQMDRPHIPQFPTIIRYQTPPMNHNIFKYFTMNIAEDKYLKSSDLTEYQPSREERQSASAAHSKKAR